MINYFEKYNIPEDIKKMSIEEINDFANQIREFLIDNVTKTGGHLASNLGVVELTLSLHNVFDFGTDDKLIFDVGHQSYVHKILTGRKEKFDSLRQFKGLSGFPKMAESKYDHFDVGHSSTSISVALGIMRAKKIKKEKGNVIALIGDGALTGGMAIEALNDVGFTKENLIIILNDNEMSIGKNVGGMSKYLSEIRVAKVYNKFKNKFNETLKTTKLGRNMVSLVDRTKDGIKQFIMPGMFFDNIGITYLGPIDGHNIKDMSKILKKAEAMEGPKLIHVVTKKGKGLKQAEEEPKNYHGISPKQSSAKKEDYAKRAGMELSILAKEHKDIVAITAAMTDGTGLNNFSLLHKERFFDVGIAEQHAVTMSAGMAVNGLKPYFAVYSTFLQRAFDQVIHDICLMNLDVTLLVDRAGLVGEDGETHQGIYDIAFLNECPNMTILCPKTIDEIKEALLFSYEFIGPLAIRYPRGSDKISLNPVKKFTYGKWEEYITGEDVLIIATGRMVQYSFTAIDILKKEGLNPTLVNATFIKPIDKQYILSNINKYKHIITVEDNVISGGLGQSINSYLNEIKTENKDLNFKVLNLGFVDRFVEHGEVDILYKENKLDSCGISEAVSKFVKKGD